MINFLYFPSKIKLIVSSIPLSRSWALWSAPATGRWTRQVFSRQPLPSSDNTTSLLLSMDIGYDFLIYASRLYSTRSTLLCSALYSALYSILLFLTSTLYSILLFLTLHYSTLLYFYSMYTLFYSSLLLLYTLFYSSLLLLYSILLFLTLRYSSLLHSTLLYSSLLLLN